MKNEIKALKDELAAAYGRPDDDEWNAMSEQEQDEWWQLLGTDGSHEMMYRAQQRAASRLDRALRKAIRLLEERQTAKEAA